MSAGGHNFVGEVLSAGRDGTFSVSRRDGAVIRRLTASRLLWRDLSLVYLLPSPASSAVLVCGFFHRPPTPASVFIVPSGGDQGSAEAPAAATIVARRAPPPTSISQGGDSAVSTAPAVSAPSGQGSAAAPAAAADVARRAPPPTSTLQGEDSAVITDPVVSVSSPPGNLAPQNTLPPSGRISTRTRQRTAAAAGSAPPAVDYGFGPGGAPRPSTRHVITPPRAPRS